MPSVAVLRDLRRLQHPPSAHPLAPLRAATHDFHVPYDSPYFIHASAYPPPIPLNPHSAPFFPPPPGTWQHIPSHYTSAPSPPPPPPPPISHKVWILDCKACNTFLTNRGMKAVLLLRPNVPLYSTDALPVNCSAYCANSSAIGAISPPSSSSNAVPHELPRTCECLTQSLCCHSCGTGVGYMIVIPCARCTSSISATNRATNGHRFVFHSTEVAASERHYILDEPGVLPFRVPLPSSGPAPMPSQPPAYITPPTSSASSHQLPHFVPSHGPSGSVVFGRRVSSPYLPTPPSEADLEPDADPRPLSPTLSISPFPSSDSFPFLISSFSPPLSPVRASPPPLPLSAPRQTGPGHVVVPFRTSFSVPMREKEEEPEPERLRAGEVLYWHQLARSGEIPGVEEDSRARRTTPSPPTRVFDR